MAVKDVLKYYEEVSAQRNDMIAELRDFEALAMNNMFDPDRLEQIKQSTQPLMRNYEMISYVVYLLNKPTKKSKHSKYDKAMSKTLNSISKENTKEGVMHTNSAVVSDLKEQKKSYKK